MQKINAKEVLVRHAAGESYEGIAQALGCARGAVYQAARRQRAKDRASDVVRSAMPGIRRAIEAAMLANPGVGGEVVE